MNKVTENFIKDGFKGGFDYRGVRKENGATVQQASMDDDWFIFAKDIDQKHPYRVVTERLVFNVKLWQAVLKHRGCPGPCDGDIRKAACGVCGGWGVSKDVSKFMHRFLDELLEGKTIDEAITEVFRPRV